MPARSCLLLVALLAAAPRVAWYASHQPDLPPDTYGYLNVAREWRGQPAPAGTWDDRAQMPANNLAARTPGYPLFLNLVFALAGHSPTPAEALVGPRRVLRPGVGTGARDEHLRHLQTDENVRAVQAAQHALGVVATGIAFLTLLAWTGSLAAAVAGALVAVGWNPIWIVTLEPFVMGETLAGLLLLVAIGLVSGRQRSLARDHAAIAASGFAVLVRPAMLISVVPLLAWLMWQHRRRPAAAVGLPATLVLVMALLVVNNGVRYGYWGISSVGGATMLSHADRHPEGLREPVRGEVVRYQAPLRAGATLPYKMASEGGRSYIEVAAELDAAARGFALDHPRWYLTSVVEAMKDFLSPPLRFVPGDVNVVRRQFPWLWVALNLLVEGLVLAGCAGLLVRIRADVRIAPIVFLVSAVGTSLTAHTENHRFAMPILPLVLMAGVAVLHSVVTRSRYAGSPDSRGPFHPTT